MRPVRPAHVFYYELMYKDNTNGPCATATAPSSDRPRPRWLHAHSAAVELFPSLAATTPPAAGPGSSTSRCSGSRSATRGEAALMDAGEVRLDPQLAARLGERARALARSARWPRDVGPSAGAAGRTRAARGAARQHLPLRNAAYAGQMLKPPHPLAWLPMRQRCC